MRTATTSHQIARSLDVAGRFSFVVFVGLGNPTTNDQKTTNPGVNLRSCAINPDPFSGSKFPFLSISAIAKPIVPFFASGPG